MHCNPRASEGPWRVWPHFAEAGFAVPASAVDSPGTTSVGFYVLSHRLLNLVWLRRDFLGFIIEDSIVEVVLRDHLKQGRDKLRLRSCRLLPPAGAAGTSQLG